MKGIEGRVALVTGAARGIGRAIAERLAAAGARVAINDIDAELAQEAASALGGQAVAVPGSVASSETTDRIVRETVDALGGLDMLVNNAGVYRDAPLHRMTDEEWDTVNDVVLRGTFNVCRSAAPLLRTPPADGHHRKVVNITSVNGVHGRELNANYCAAKAGVIGLTKSLAREWASRQVNVNAVAPGFIGGTRLTAVREGPDGVGMAPEMHEAVVSSIPIGRGGRPSDIAGAVAFLCSEEADYITGQVLEVHGGLELIQVPKT